MLLALVVKQFVAELHAPRPIEGCIFIGCEVPFGSDSDLRSNSWQWVIPVPFQGFWRSFLWFLRQDILHGPSDGSQMRVTWLPTQNRS